jgi:hypothetical protein
MSRDHDAPSDGPISQSRSTVNEEYASGEAVHVRWYSGQFVHDSSPASIDKVNILIAPAWYVTHGPSVHPCQPDHARFKPLGHDLIPIL